MSIQSFQTNQAGISGDRFLRINQIIGDKDRGITPIIPISKSSWWDGVKTGKYPKPVKLGPRTTVWRLSEVQAVVERINNESS